MSDLQKTAQLIAQFNAQIRAQKIRGYKPYPWQKEFHDAGATNAERMLIIGSPKKRSSPDLVAAKSSLHNLLLHVYEQGRADARLGTRSDANRLRKASRHGQGVV